MAKNVLDNRKYFHYAVQMTASWRDSNGEVYIEEIGYDFIPTYFILEDEKIERCKLHIASVKRVRTYHSDKVEVVKDSPEEFELKYKESGVKNIYGEEIDLYQFINYKIVKVKIRNVE